jgi:plastocyanin
LHNLEATEEQLLRLMEKAETVEEMLDVQRELSRTRGEIEQTKGRMQYLERTSATSLIEVHLEQARLDVNFAADKRTVKEGQKVQFTIRQIAGGFAPYSYEWDFGDGNTSTDKAPTHAYKTAGSYTVSLKVTDDRGNTDTETRHDYITVLPGWSAGIIASGAWNGLVTFGHVLVNIFIWVGIFSPVWIVIGVIVYFAWWRRRRRKKAQ